MRALFKKLWNSATFTTWGSLGVRLSAVAVLLPLVLVRFSPAEVAVWQLFATLFTLILLLDFGLSPTFSRLLAYARGGASIHDMAAMTAQRGARNGGQATGMNRHAGMAIVSTLRWLYPRLSLGILVPIGLFGTWALQTPIAQTASPQNGWVAWAIALLTSAFGLWGNAYAAALQGMDRIAVLRRWEVLTGLGQIVSAIIVLSLGGGLLMLVITYQSWVVLNAWRNRMLLKALHPELFEGIAERNTQVLHIMWPATWRSGIGVLMSQGIIQSSGLVYSQMASPAEVASYLLALRIMTTISQFAQAPFYSKLPRLAELQAQDRHAEQLVIAKNGMTTAHWVLTAGAISAAFSIAPLLHWLGSKTAFVTPETWALICIAFFIERFGAMHLQLYTLTNHVVWHIANGVTGLLMIAIAVIAYPLIGTYAFPLAMLLAYAGFYAPYSAHKSATAHRIALFEFEMTSSLPALGILGFGLLAAVWMARNASSIF